MSLLAPYASQYSDVLAEDPEIVRARQELVRQQMAERESLPQYAGMQHLPFKTNLGPISQGAADIAEALVTTEGADWANIPRQGQATILGSIGDSAHIMAELMAMSRHGFTQMDPEYTDFPLTSDRFYESMGGDTSRWGIDRTAGLISPFALPRLAYGAGTGWARAVPALRRATERAAKPVPGGMHGKQAGAIGGPKNPIDDLPTMEASGDLIDFPLERRGKLTTGDYEIWIKTNAYDHEFNRLAVEHPSLSEDALEKLMPPGLLRSAGPKWVPLGEGTFPSKEAAEVFALDEVGETWRVTRAGAGPKSSDKGVELDSDEFVEIHDRITPQQREEVARTYQHPTMLMDPDAVPGMPPKLVDVNAQVMTDYRGSHEAPTRAMSELDGTRNTMNDLADMYGNDLDNPQFVNWYGSGIPEERARDAESVAVMRAAKGNPDKKVLVYRAVPIEENLDFLHNSAKKYKNAEEFKARGFDEILKDVRGVERDSVVTIPTDKVEIKWKDDYKNALDTAKKDYNPKTALPVDLIYDFKKDKYILDDGHNRYVSAQRNNQPIKGVVQHIEGNMEELADLYKKEKGESITDIWNKANKVDPLTEEAKKYKSAEEFVASQDISAVSDYYTDTGEARELAHKAKKGDPVAISKMAEEMAILVPKETTLIPVPSSLGKATITKELVDKIAEITGSKVADIVTGNKRASLYSLKKKGKSLSKDELGFKLSATVPKGKYMIVDTVLGTGTTMRAIKGILPNARILVHSIDKQQLTDIWNKANKADPGETLSGAKETGINAGDWVTQSRKYAEEHGQRHLGETANDFELAREGVQFKIIEQEVYADELFSEGNSIHEWGYDPR